MRGTGASMTTRWLKIKNLIVSPVNQKEIIANSRKIRKAKLRLKNLSQKHKNKILQK